MILPPQRPVSCARSLLVSEIAWNVVSVRGPDEPHNLCVTLQLVRPAGECLNLRQQIPVDAAGQLWGNQLQELVPLLLG